MRLGIVSFVNRLKTTGNVRLSPTARSRPALPLPKSGPISQDAVLIGLAGGASPGLRTRGCGVSAGVGSDGRSGLVVGDEGSRLLFSTAKEDALVANLHLAN
jgi:hypothetical protein